MRTLLYMAAGALTLFNFLLILMMLLFFWPRMLPDIADGTYDYMTQVRFILAGCLFVGLLGAFGGLVIEEIDEG
jgi:hypothetical protein